MTAIIPHKQPIPPQDVLDRIRNSFTGGFSPDILGLSVVGSMSHGTYVPDHIDDWDYMGVVLPPAEYVFGLSNWEHWDHKKDEWDVVFYSLHKFVRLLLKSNPNVVGLLWMEDDQYLVRTPEFDFLRENRDKFVSLKAFGSFIGYAYSQLKKMEHAAYKGYMGEKRKELVKKIGYDAKHASHLIRLLRMLVEFLDTGEMQIWRPDRDELLAIKMGEWSLERVRVEADRLFAVAEAAKNESNLPQEPDYEFAEKLVMDIVRDRYL